MSIDIISKPNESSGLDSSNISSISIKLSLS